MTSTTSGSPAQVAPAPPLFSYAQAAKGRATATAASSILSNQSTSGISTPAKDTISAINTPPASINGATTGSEVGDRSTNGTYDAVSKSDPLGVGMESESKSTTLVNSGSIPASPSFGTASTSTLPKEEDLTLPTTTQSESVWDRTPTVNGIEKAGEATEGRRGKKGKKQKNAEKEAEKEAEKQKEEERKLESLVAAPPPAVNIWQQRKEAQALKVKPSPPITQTLQTFIEATSITEPAAKPSESKRRGKNNANDDGEKTSSVAQAGLARDSLTTSKGQKKSSDGTSKGKEDSSNKRAAPRGSRATEKDEKPIVSQLPPPVEDATSWPTPETALEEEKRKALEREKSEKDKEREERDETASNKPRPKDKWVPVPYVPSVNFNTPIPTRGGRGRGGARGGRESTGRGSHATNGGSNGDRANNGSITAASPAVEETRGRGGPTTARSSSLPPNSSKRPSSGSRLQGKAAPITNEKSKSGHAGGSTKNASTMDSHRPSAVAQLEQSSESQPLIRGENSRGSRSEITAASSNDNILKSTVGDRRSETNAKGTDQFKEGVNYSKDSSQARDRADGRADRGRGGTFRGRGGHSNFPNGQQPQPQHAFANGHGPQPLNGYPARQNSNSYSPSMAQPPFSNQFAQAPMRSGRGGSRSQSIPNNAVYGRYQSHMHPQMAPLQTQNGMYDYQQQPLQTMSAGPYASFPEQFQLLAMVTMQLEYYFSIDNLCKDVFLRKHMDSQGFVFLAFIAGFKRIQALTGEIETLRFACQESNKIEIVKGDDGIDRVRIKDGWDKWILSMEERDESVRTTGPSYFHTLDSNTQQVEQARQIGYPQASYHMGMSPPPFSPTNTESHFSSPYVNGSQFAPANGNAPPETPLSAAVPVFSPSLPQTNGATDRLDEETTFRNEDVANLKLVFKNNGVSKAGAPFHSSSSRTFSNGSIDGRSIAEELQNDDSRQGRGLTNGSRGSEISPDGLRRSRSPFAPISPTKSDTNNGPPVMWVKGQRQQAPIPTDNTDELYVSVRANALRMRELSAPGDTHPSMKQLYEFWSHFLCRNFNPTMYREFRQYAMEDAGANAMVGLKNLITYYDETLNNKKKVIPDTLARHYIEIVNLEKESTIGSPLDRPAFTKLRLAWRNGALDMKSRKKIDNLVNAALKEELER